MMSQTVSLTELLSALDQEYHLIGKQDRQVSRPAPIDDADEESLCFCSKAGSQGLAMIEKTLSRVIICPDSLDLSFLTNAEKTLVQVANPRLAFVRLLHRFFVPRPEYGIHPMAVIGKNSDIHSEVSIGPYTVIGDECRIGRGTIIGANTTIYRRANIGKRVVIHSGAVIGADGFGFEREATGEWVNFPQLGNVTIEDDVEVGANVCIDRGTLADTVIGQGTKIDNLVHIAHNVRVGKHCIIVALVFLGGGVDIGDGSWIAPDSSIREQVVVGKNTLVGMGAVVLRDVPDSVVVTGVPARILRKNK